MKLALLSLTAVVSAVAPRDPPPKNSNPVQTGGETTPTLSLTIMPIVSFTPFPTSSSTDQVTIPIFTSDSTHTTHTFPPTSESSPAPTSNTSGSSSHHSSSGIGTHNSTASSTTGTGPGTGTGTSGSPSSSRTTSAPSSSLSSAAAAAATANIIAGIVAVAGLVMAA